MNNDDERDYEEEKYNRRVHDTGDGEHESVPIPFTDEDRRRVSDVLERVWDEMLDSHTLSSMFAPYGRIVHIILTDAQITLQLEEHAADA